MLAAVYALHSCLCSVLDILSVAYTHCHIDPDLFKPCLVVLICEYQGTCFEDERVTPVYLISLLRSVSRYERSG
ncbi:Chitinase 1 [Dorcoceras hygrometricum]|uniref:Chitinase 1 n=1 Tax=Dorcoceras hygrometricum TaxID=472368 RepID=A0A2Z7AKL4_9LAMI|nr:Chitinase 1 [Dorcoceras hygrometricum]